MSRSYRKCSRKKGCYSLVRAAPPGWFPPQHNVRKTQPLWCLMPAQEASDAEEEKVAEAIGQPAQILGFCALSAAHLHLSELQQADLKRLPAYPVPAMRMGRLAVSASEQGKGYGQLLLGHVVNLALSVRQTMGVRVLIVDS